MLGFPRRSNLRFKRIKQANLLNSMRVLDVTVYQNIPEKNVHGETMIDFVGFYVDEHLEVVVGVCCAKCFVASLGLREGLQTFLKGQAKNLFVQKYCN